MSLEKINELYNSEDKNKTGWLIVIGLALIVFVFSIIGATAYIGGTEHAVDGYSFTDEGQFEITASIPRGRQVRKTLDSYNNQGQKMRRIRYNDKLYYVYADSLCSSKKSAVREEEVYVRTSAVIYENEEGPEIASFMKKGSKRTEMDSVSGYSENLDYRL